MKRGQTKAGAKRLAKVRAKRVEEITITVTVSELKDPIVVRLSKARGLSTLSMTMGSENFSKLVESMAGMLTNRQPSITIHELTRR
jgi:hypothetical protein